MVTVNSKYAKLNKEAINKLQALEKEIGSIVIAYDNEPIFANLTQDQLQKVQQLEKEIGAILIAYKM